MLVIACTVARTDHRPPVLGLIPPGSPWRARSARWATALTLLRVAISVRAGEAGCVVGSSLFGPHWPRHEGERNRFPSLTQFSHETASQDPRLAVERIGGRIAAETSSSDGRRWQRGHLVLGPAVLAQPAMARCSWQLRLMDVALGLGFKAGDMRSLSRQVLGDGMGAGRVGR